MGGEIGARREWSHDGAIDWQLLDQAPHAYEIFQKKQDGAVKILLKPGMTPSER